MKIRKIATTLPVAILFFISPLWSQNVGIGTEYPTAMLDVNGDVIFRTGDLSLVDEIEQVLDVNSNRFSYYRITGPTADFDISGISAGADGRLLTLFNRSGFTMILHALDTDVDTTERILTSDGLDLLVPDRNMVNLSYDGNELKWVVKSASASGGIGWNMNGENIFYESNVGIGTSEPVSPLTIQTDSNSIGLTQIGGPDSITLVTRINGESASIGTTSDHTLSLQSGGVDQVHVLPTGNVILGSDPNPVFFTGHSHSRDLVDTKLTLETDLGKTGWTHVATGETDQIVVDESIGQSSASIGTNTNNSFRIKSNGIGRLHVWYDGRVAIGTNTDAPNSQFTVFTPPNTYGISHTTTGGIVLASHIGTSSASFGTETYNEFRLVSNGATVMTCAPTGNVGIGTTNPPRKLSIYTEPNNFGFSQISSGGIEIASHIGMASASFGTRTNNKFRLVANDVNVMTIHPNGNVGIGMDDPNNKLEVNGTVRSKEVIVESANWPDYVFNPDYPLSSLRDLENYILEHKHLPNIPSAQAIEEHGQALGEVQKRMMEKIEELTLHILELNKRIEMLENTK